jgi:competence protein ComEC
MSYAKVTVLSMQQSLLVQAKSEFSKGVRRALPEPAASFVLGILIGARSTLPNDLQNTMALIGLSHLVAVSGYNLTIITLATQRLLGKRWQWAGLITTLWLIVGFVILTGASASIVRAGIMSTLFLLAAYYGRKLDVLTCLALGVIVTLGWSPRYIADLGWQLSFLALGGIVLLTPVVQTFIPKRFGVIGEIAAVSIAAQLATMPLIAFTFGSLSVVAPLANVLVLPLVPLLMFVGFVVGVVGMLVPASAFALSWPVASLVAGLLDAMRYLGGLPRASVQNAAPHLAGVLAFYCLLCLLGILARRRSLGSTTTDVIITGMSERRLHERT